MSAITGFSSQKKLTTKLGSFDQDLTDDRSQFATLQKNYSDKVGIDSVSIGYFKLNAGPLTINAVSVLPRRQLNIVGHGAKEGDMIRFAATSSLPGFESKVNHIIDANNLIIASLLPLDPTPADPVDVLRAVTQRFANDGTISVSIAPSPIIFVKDGVDTEVKESTTVPADSEPLPVKQIARFTQSGLVDASSSNIDNTTGQALVTLSSYASEMEVINSTGLPLSLTIGSDIIYVSGGGLMRQPIAYPSGAAIVVKTVQAITADSGVVAINLFN